MPFVKKMSLYPVTTPASGNFFSDLSISLAFLYASSSETVKKMLYSLLYLFIAWIIDLKEIYLLSKLITKAQQLQKKITGVFIPYE